MRVAIEALPEGVQVEVEGKRATVTYGPENERVSVITATDGESIIMFPDRSYRHEEMAVALGLKS